MFVTGLPGLRVGELSRRNARELVELVAQVETTFFGQSQTNLPEILGTLAAPELHGTRGTAGVWENGRLVAAALVYDDLAVEKALAIDLFVAPGRRRALIAGRLLAGVLDYATTLGPDPLAWLKVETFGGDAELARVVREDGFVAHRVYLRMRRDFTTELEPARLPQGFTVTGMRDALWPHVHDVITHAFRDHYDSHPAPLETFCQRFDHETTDLGQWRLVFEDEQLVGLGISSNRYAAAGLGYVDTLAVRRSARGRGLGTYLLRQAFLDDRERGLRGTALHCDAENLTGATRLYEAAGMHRDQHYDAWKRHISPVWATPFVNCDLSHKVLKSDVLTPESGQNRRNPLRNHDESTDR